MRQLWLFYEDYYQCIELDEHEVDKMTVGPEVSDDVTIHSFPFMQGPIVMEAGRDGYSVQENNERLGFLKEQNPVSVTRKGRTLQFLLTKPFGKKNTYYMDFENEISFGLDEDHADINLLGGKTIEQKNGRFTFYKASASWTVALQPGCRLYINGRKIDRDTKVGIGDVLQWAFMEIRLVAQDLIEISSVHEYQSALPRFDMPQSEMAKTYPDYRRTPRMIYEMPEEKVSLSFPAQESEDNGRGLWLIIAPPLVMLVVMGLVALLIPRGIFIIISISMFLMTLVTSTVQYFKDKKRRKLNEEKRRRVYTAYLQNMREELHELSTKQKEVMTYHFPTFEQMKHMTDHISGRIWERTLESEDFLEFRLGIGNVPSSYEISLSSGDLANREIDDLLEQSQRMEEVYKEITAAPITAGLFDGILGLVGKESVTKRELHQIVGQLAFSHSYHDVRFVFIFNHADYTEFEWMKWLPHFMLPHMHAKGFIHNEQTRDQLLSSLYEIIRERDIDENKGELRFTPHLIFIITDYSLLSEHVILEYLEGKDHAALGISVIFAATAQERITENVHTLVRYVNENEGDILMVEKKAVQIPFKLDTHHRPTNERFARTLKTLNHQVGMTNSIPTSVSFLEMFDAKDVDELAIADYWLTNESAKSLAVPIGFKGKEDLVELNLHEKAHGPHGLLAGTTGSGKSEFLQTYILSLAVNFHPYEVAFLLIDYKGGGMAQPFRNIPHLLGTITNIEGSQNFSMRALASINSELKRRQRLFDQYVVTHIDDYTALYKEGVTTEPLPHLFLISDEFAELKSEEPDFIRELVSTARIGRSLGVHLILATQKPGGIIDEQIWSNARFRVALKVQDASDSKEILKNGDAASITVTGRGYLQVGNNEVYELFQSAWSGAPYQEETAEGEDEVALVTDLGLYPLSGIETSRRKKKGGITEIEAVTEKIAETQKELSIGKLASPWLPPLPTRIQKETGPAKSSEVVIGMIDEPDKQSQTPIAYRIVDDGNIGIFGSPGYGKSYTLLTILLGIGESVSPEEANFYILDYGNGSLLPLKQLVHTADYFTIDEELKRDKFIKMIKDEIAKRKIAFQKAEVSHIHMYNNLDGHHFPLLYIAVDNFDIVREEMEALEMQLNQFGRDGQSLGIYLFVTATRAQSVRQSLMNNLKTKIVHYLMDKSESFNVIGRVPFDAEPFPGRGIIKKEEAFFSQLYLPAAGEDDFEVLAAIKQNVQQLNDLYRESEAPASIPMLPLELTTDNFGTYVGGRVSADGLVPIGLDEETVEPVTIDFRKDRHCLLIGQAGRGKTNMLKLMLQTVTDQEAGFVAIFDSFDRGLASFGQAENVDYLETKEQLTEWLTQVEQFFTEVEREYLAHLQRGEGSVEVLPSYLVIDGYARFLQVADIGIQDRLSKLMKLYSHLGFNVIVSGNNAEITKGYDAFTNELKLVRQALIFMKKSEQTLYTVPYERREQELPLGYAHYILNGKDMKVQTPLCKIERKILQ